MFKESSRNNKHLRDVLKSEEKQEGKKNILALGDKMNADLMLAQDSDQEKLVGSHPEGDAGHVNT